MRFSSLLLNLKTANRVLMNSLRHHRCPAPGDLHPAGAGGTAGQRPRVAGGGTCSVHPRVASGCRQPSFSGPPTPPPTSFPLHWGGRVGRESKGGGGTPASPELGPGSSLSPGKPVAGIQPPTARPQAHGSPARTLREPPGPPKTQCGHLQSAEGVTPLLPRAGPRSGWRLSVVCGVTSRRR